MKVGIISGYMDPCTVGHIEYIKLAKEFVGTDGKLVVIINNDEQAVLKKGRSFMSCDDRITIIKALRDVDDVIKSVDYDRTVCKTIKIIREIYDDKFDMWFLNGGDAFNDKIPEKQVCDELGIKLADGLGGKIRSSSWLTGLTAK
jgi:cytidyltransferase-like protein